jgi:hypothetical protein
MHTTMDLALCVQGIHLRPTPPASPLFPSWTTLLHHHHVPPTKPSTQVQGCLQHSTLTSSHPRRPSFLALPTTHLAQSSITFSKTTTNQIPPPQPLITHSTSIPTPWSNHFLQNSHPRLPFPTVSSGLLDTHVSLDSNKTANHQLKFVKTTPRLGSLMGAPTYVPQVI